MNQLSFFWSQIVEIYQQVFSMLRKNPAILFLFLWIGIFDVLALTALFFAPSPPFSYVLAPIIRTFWSDDFLHYPSNFLLLPKLFGHAHFLISTIIGVFITGLVIKKIEAESKGDKISTLAAAGLVFKRYFSLVIAWLVSYGLFVFALKGVLMLLPRNFLAQLAGSYFLSVIIQSLIVFLMPALVIIENGFFKTVFEGFRFGLKHVVQTSALIVVPMFLGFIISVLRIYTPVFVQIYPELVLWVLAIGIVISLVVDILITSSATLLFLKVRNQK